MSDLTPDFLLAGGPKGSKSCGLRWLHAKNLRVNMHWWVRQLDVAATFAVLSTNRQRLTATVVARVTQQSDVHNADL